MNTTADKREALAYIYVFKRKDGQEGMSLKFKSDIIAKIDREIYVNPFYDKVTKEFKYYIVTEVLKEDKEDGAAEAKDDKKKLMLTKAKSKLNTNAPF